MEAGWSVVWVCLLCLEMVVLDDFPLLFTIFYPVILTCIVSIIVVAENLGVTQAAISGPRYAGTRCRCLFGV